MNGLPAPLLLGIDGGGTSTIAWLAAGDGRVLGRGRAGPSNAKAVGQAAAHEALGQAIARSFADACESPRPAAVACLGLAGFDRPEDRSLLSGWAEKSGWADRIVMVNDGDLVLAAGTPEGWGLAVIAGTGSIAVGRTSEGRTARSGGWGPLIGDEGSAYAVSLSALRLVARRADGREPRPDGDDPLTDRLCTALGVAGPSEIVSAIYTPGFDRVRIAALAPAVLDAVQDDPDLIARLLEPAGSALAEMVDAVARALGWSGGRVPLALAGSFLLGAGHVSRALISGLRQGGFDVDATPVAEPVQGALILASRAWRRQENVG
jgi:N-acetylglucosamine kinase-like BadF-type ATPase